MKHSILYLEDNVRVAEAVREYLGAVGYAVDCAHTVEQAWAKIPTKTYSLVLVDLRLSTAALDGFEFACRLRDRSPWVPLILFTAYISPEVEVAMIERKMQAIAKPKPLPELANIITGYLREKYPAH